MSRMDYTEINIDQRFHRHLIGKNGANSESLFERYSALLKYEVAGIKKYRLTINAA